MVVNLVNAMPLGMVAILYEEIAKKCELAASASLVAAVSGDLEAVEKLGVELDAHLKAMAICLRRLGRHDELGVVENTIAFNNKDLVKLRQVKATQAAVGKINSFGSAAVS